LVAKPGSWIEHQGHEEHKEKLRALMPGCPGAVNSGSDADMQDNPAVRESV